MPSLVASCMCPNWRSNPQPWPITATSNQLSYLARAQVFLIISKTQDFKLMLTFKYFFPMSVTLYVSNIVFLSPLVIHSNTHNYLRIPKLIIKLKNVWEV